MRVLRGISFDMTMSSDYILWEILKSVYDRKRIWHIDSQQTEVWNKENEEYFFEKEVYTNDELYTLLQTPHFPIFLKLGCFAADHNTLFPSIHTFSDYLHSECELLMLLYDCSHVDIYTKKLNDLLTLWLMCKRNGFSKIRLVSRKNDTRTTMDLM